MSKYGLKINNNVISSQRYLWFKEFKSGKKIEKQIYEMTFTVRDGETPTFFYRSIESGDAFKPLTIIKDNNTYKVRTLGNCLVFMFTDININEIYGKYGLVVKVKNKKLWESNEPPLRMLKQVLLPPYGNISENYAGTGKCIAIQPLGSRVYGKIDLEFKKLWLLSDIFSMGENNHILARKFMILDGVKVGASGSPVGNDLITIPNFDITHPILDGISMNNPIMVNVIDVTEILQTFNLDKVYRYI